MEKEREWKLILDQNNQEYADFMATCNLKEDKINTMLYSVKENKVWTLPESSSAIQKMNLVDTSLLNATEIANLANWNTELPVESEENTIGYLNNLGAKVSQK